VPEPVIAAGCPVVVTSVDGRRLRKIATSGIVSGYDFLVVWACREEEWAAAKAAGREPDAMPWPAETVTAVSA